MNRFAGSIRRVWPLLFAVMITASALAVSGTLAFLTERSKPVINHFMPDKLTQAKGEADIHVLKTVRNLGNQTMLPGGFTFALTNDKTGETETAITAADGKAMFRLSFDADDVGTHLYRLTEVRGTVPGVTYSEQEYEVRVDVTLDDELRMTIYVNGEKTEMPLAIFENLYDVSIPPVTGDQTPLLGYGLLMLASIAGIWLLMRKRGAYAA